MSFHVEIELQACHVLILGAGKVGYRKAKQCLKEGAQVSVFSQTFLPAFDELPIIRKYPPYDRSLLLAYDLIIAASSDHAFQAKIIQDAKDCHRLCMGVHASDHAPLHPMVSKDYEQFTIALSSRGHYPAAAAYLAETAGAYLQQQEQERMMLLTRLRGHIKSQCERSLRHMISRTLVSLSICQLRRFETIITCGNARILCYHGVHNVSALSQVESFVSLVQEQVEGEGVESAYMNEAVCESLHQKKASIWNLKELLTCLRAFPHVQMTLVPMLFQYGHYYDTLKALKTKRLRVLSPLWQEESDRTQLIALIRQQYPEMDAVLIRYHSTPHTSYHSYSDTKAKPYVYFSIEKEKAPFLSSKPKCALIVPLYILAGMHMHADMNEEGELAQSLKQQGIRVSWSPDSVIACPWMRPLLISKVLR